MKVSILLLTIDRYEITKRCVDQALQNAGVDYELLCADNGSQDSRVIEYIKSLNPAVHVLNSENKGIAPMHNFLLSQATGDYFVLIGNDILLPDGWLKALVESYPCVRNAGIAGIHCVEKLHPAEKLNNGMVIHPGPNVFGTMFFGRALFNTIGFFNPIYHPYGMDDSDFALRARETGHVNFYLHGLSSEHIGADMDVDSDYRKMKTESLHRNTIKFNEAVEEYRLTGNYYIPFQQDEPYIIFNKQFDDGKY
jgi:glycosyltransferase involved in cell wall biosynthesis